MIDLVAKHEQALRRIKSASGVAVSFDLVESTYDETTDTHSAVVTSSVEGYAVEIPGKSLDYEENSLRVEEAMTLLFVPNTFGELPSMRSNVTWAGNRKTVAKIDPIRPSGEVIASKVVVV